MDNLFGIHATALKLRANRAELLAANIANADTPNYKARDIDFKKTLGMVASEHADMKVTNVRHINSAGNSKMGAEILYRTPNQPSLDGNTVDLQTERSAFMENSMMYQASLRFLNGRINGLMTAIRGEI
ncbi:MAG: flagellar basal body rod protein FlgB [Proteobacteria bacterium]|nr:flagellar basal body rod protein FlgB [Pseudomonadota bacterium]NOG58918.1 flagellar basal body rod protein FlgB [Pseudomonadota bacterium]